jgi:hypothetical protein
MLDLSTTVGKPSWFILPNTQVGIRGTWRSLDQNSPRYLTKLFHLQHRFKSSRIW